MQWPSENTIYEKNICAFFSLVELKRNGNNEFRITDQ